MRTLTALYDSRADAERVRDELIAAGIPDADVQITAQTTGAADVDTTTSARSEGGGFLQGLKDFFMPDDDRYDYEEGIRRGGCLLTVRAADGQEGRVSDILESSDAVDFDARVNEWKASGWTGTERGSFSDRDTLRDNTEEAIPIAQERINVGKREVDRGSVRVRSYVVEEPVHEQVNLREEHIDIERRPVDEPVRGDADHLFEERTFAATERGEEAVVSKETEVTEEVRLRKDVDERVEDIEDTVRRTEVDIDDDRTGETRLREDRDDLPPSRI
jgi:uncharacterized protein (TIGR02271 family)